MRHLLLVIGALGLIGMLGTPRAAAASARKPEDPGGFAFHVSTVRVTLGVDPNGPSGAFPDILVDLYVPAGGAGPWPVLELSHGNMNTRADHAEWGRRLASRGILAIVPDRRQQTFLGSTPAPLEPHLGDSGDFDWRVDSEDQLRVLRWALAQSAAGTGPLAGRVDPNRLALAGHSLGGSYAANAIGLAQTEGPRLAAGLLLDDTTGPPGYDPAARAATYRVPTAVLASDPAAGSPGNACGLDPGACTTVLQSDHSLEGAHATFAALPATLPKLGIQVVAGLHGEMEDPDYDDTNPSVAHQRLYQRYGMAWLECWLLHDRSAATYLNGPAARADQTDGRVLVFKGSTPVPDDACGSGAKSTAVAAVSVTRATAPVLPNTGSTAPGPTAFLLLLGLGGMALRRGGRERRRVAGPSRLVGWDMSQPLLRRDRRRSRESIRR